MTNRYGFTLSNMTFPDEDELFGIWEVPRVAATAFAAAGASEPAGPLFEARLPALQDEAERLLRTREAALGLSLKDLAEAEERMNVVSAGVSFSEIGGPEADLQRAMNTIYFPLSFAADETAREDKRGLIEQWRAFVAQVHRMISHFTTVITEIDGIPIGHTAVGWTGDFDNYLDDDPGSKHLDLHQKNVQLSLATRTAVIRLMIVVSTGAVKLGTRMGIPGAQILLLPDAYKFVRDVLKELRPLWPNIKSVI